MKGIEERLRAAELERDALKANPIPVQEDPHQFLLYASLWWVGAHSTLLTTKVFSQSSILGNRHYAQWECADDGTNPLPTSSKHLRHLSRLF